MVRSKAARLGGLAATNIIPGSRNLHQRAQTAPLTHEIAPERIAVCVGVAMPRLRRTRAGFLHPGHYPFRPHPLLGPAHPRDMKERGYSPTPFCQPYVQEFLLDFVALMFYIRSQSVGDPCLLLCSTTLPSGALIGRSVCLFRVLGPAGLLQSE
jgi:hypothetical protein